MLLSVIGLVGLSYAFGQISTLPASESFNTSTAFTTGTPATFIPNWDGNEVATTNRIYQNTTTFNSGDADLAIIPTSSFNGEVIVHLDLTNYQSVQFDFYAKSMANGGGSRDAELTIETSIDGGVNWVGSTFIGAFPNIDQPSFATYTYVLPTAANNQSDVLVKFYVTRSSTGSGAASQLNIDDVAITGTLAAPGPAVNLSTDLSAGSEAGTTVVTITATAATAVTGDQTVTLSAGGTNINTNDYTFSNTDITILNGTTTGSVTFTIVDDNLNEGTETANISISGVTTGVSIGSVSSVSVDISDNDTAVEMLVLNTANPTIDFNELGNSGVGLFDITKGFYTYEIGSNADATYRADDGTSTTGDVYSYGLTSSTERAFGSITTGSLDTAQIGAQLVNTTGSVVNALTISYTGEQWRGSDAGEDTLSFYYSTDATALDNGTWILLNDLSFAAPNINASVAGALNGNDPANQTAVSFQISGLNLNNNDGIWIKWQDINISGSDQGLAIDDLIITPQFIGAPATLFINEIMASNSTTVADENGEFDDWIEIYNPGTSDVSIAGYYVTDDFTNAMKYHIPDTATNAIVPAGGWLLIWADNQDAQGNLHTTFALSAGGEQAGLVAPDGVTYVDSLTFGAQTSDVSWGRDGDGDLNWIFFNVPTPDASNIVSTSGLVNPENNPIVMYPNPTKGKPFVMFTENVNLTLVSLSGNVLMQANNVNSIDVSLLSKGIYIIQLDNGNTRKLVIND